MIYGCFYYIAKILGFSEPPTYASGPPIIFSLSRKSIKLFHSLGCYNCVGLLRTQAPGREQSVTKTVVHQPRNLSKSQVEIEKVTSHQPQHNEAKKVIHGDYCYYNMQGLIWGAGRGTGPPGFVISPLPPQDFTCFIFNVVGTSI